MALIYVSLFCEDKSLLEFLFSRYVRTVIKSFITCGRRLETYRDVFHTCSFNIL